MHFWVKNIPRHQAGMQLKNKRQEEEKTCQDVILSQRRGRRERNSTVQVVVKHNVRAVSSHCLFNEKAKASQQLKREHLHNNHHQHNHMSLFIP